MSFVRPKPTLNQDKFWTNLNYQAKSKHLIELSDTWLGRFLESEV